MSHISWFLEPSEKNEHLPEIKALMFACIGLLNLFLCPQICNINSIITVKNPSSANEKLQKHLTYLLCFTNDTVVAISSKQSQKWFQKFISPDDYHLRKVVSQGPW